MFFLTKKLPKIVIKYARFLDPVFIAYVKSHKKWENIEIPNEEVVLERIKNYRKAWRPKERIILNGLTEASGLSFKRNTLDVYIVSLNPRQFSSPIVIKSGFESEDFVDVLTHELIHALLTDNIYLVDDRPYWIKKFPEETQTTYNHILLSAIQTYIYLDVLKDQERLQRNIKRDEQHSNNDYLKAWEIVDKMGGYKEVLKIFQQIKKEGCLS